MILNAPLTVCNHMGTGKHVLVPCETISEANDILDAAEADGLHALLVIKTSPLPALALLTPQEN